MGRVIAMHGHAPACSISRRAAADAETPAETQLRQRAAARRAALDWMETQARVLDQWRAMMVGIESDQSLIGALDAHAAFLSEAAARLR